MNLTIHDLKERLAKCEETYLMELLGLTSQDLVDRFDDRIEEDFDRLMSELEDFGEEDEEENQQEEDFE